MARTAKKKIQLLDDGSNITEDVDSIDFTGLGITVTNSGNAATANVPLRGVGFTTVTVSATQPVAPSVNDLWVDIS